MVWGWGGVGGLGEVGSRLTAVVGFRSASETFWLEKFRETSDRVVVMTEDGTAGVQGTTVDGLKGMLEAGEPIDQVLTAGPLGMMQAVAEATRPWEVPTVASMNPIMVDGIGMCGSCRVRVGEKILFACVDGPDMDAHRVDFEELKGRQRRFLAEERKALEQYRCGLEKKGVSCPRS